MITSNIYIRVFRITTELGSSGTAFIIDEGDEQFLVTARHVLPNGTGPFPVTLDGNNNRSQDEVDFNPLPGILPNADVAVSALSLPITAAGFPVEASMESIVYGQDCYFLGYPFRLGFGGDSSPQLAFVKKAILSASDENQGVHILYLDGHNNPGFSGGPVVYYRNGDRNQPCIAGVVSAYRIQETDIEIDGAKVPRSLVRANSGIIIATAIAHVVDAVREFKDKASDGKTHGF